jgi:hypothetical protein
MKGECVAMKEIAKQILIGMLINLCSGILLDVIHNYLLVY